jgi:hypothetical protein
MLGFTSPRAWAFGLLGVDEYSRAFRGDSQVQAVQIALATRLFTLLQETTRPDWPWFEDRLTYSNARLPQALLVSGRWLDHPEMVADGLRSLQWLVSVQVSEEGYFAPIGSNGFHLRDGPKALFDQQPVEAWGVISACLEAERLTQDPDWRDHARRAFDWFLGQNLLHVPLYDPTTGGCRDGLHADRANENQGAESTLAFLLSLSEMRLADRSTAAAPPMPIPKTAI